MSGAEVGQIAMNALLLSGVLAVVALGFALVWGITNIVNLAHGAFIVIGAYVTFGLHDFWSMDPFLSIPISMAALFALGFLIQRALINQIIRAPLLATFLLTFGLESLIVNLLRFFFRADTRSVMTAYSGAALALGPVRVPYIRLGALGVSILLVLLLAAFLTRSRLGRAIRATGMDVDAARLTGVKVATVYAITFGIGAALAGAAGSLLSMIVPFDPNLGGGYTERAFIICVLGGLGNVVNVLAGAAAYSVVEVVVGSRLPAFSQAITFGMLVLLLAVRPQGIAGKAFS
ncbi:branched-chain amino acid ABC transporter permease [Anaeromyxobacter oryzisoli]|uniref:branched-chain amino acid ABC transporter permease n=1 Tax=Anaeromyxobacter oryzisoli TaxID=2925408 RepID=UPI001F57B94F|nr:branched-chain amino acid ABC transporter permease [Anaeromyxobacter sp. SG63]